MLARSLLIVGAVILTVSCGADEPAIETDAGGCISVEGKSVDYVDCKSPGAQVLVVRMAEDADAYPCPTGLDSVTFESTLDGNAYALPIRWCVVPPSELTAEHQRRINERKAEQKNTP